MALVTLTIDSICVILFTLGFIGNLLGIIVFSSRRFRCCSTYATLALTSFVINLVCIIRYSFILHTTTRRWLSENIVSTNWLACKIYRLSSSFRVLAAWVTVFWVIERFVYVNSRLHVLWNQRDRFSHLQQYKFPVMILIAMLMLFIVTGPTVLFFSPNLSNTNGTESTIQCTYNYRSVSTGWHNYFDNPSFGFNYHTIRCLLSELIPSVLVAFFNIGIIGCIICRTAQVRRQQQFNHRNQLSMTLMTGSISKLPVSAPIHGLDPPVLVQRQSLLKTSSNSSAQLGKMSWMNIVLLLHSLLFFLSSSITSLVFFCTSNLILAHWVSVIILANCSLNFYVYCLSGRQFRRELKRIAKRYVRHVHKVFLRNCHSTDHRRRSPSHNAKKNIYHPVDHMKHRNGLSPVLLRTFPAS